MIRYYKSKSDISINVLLDSGKNLHIKFLPSSDGSSHYTTNNREIQKAIEKHRYYGKLFRMECEIRERIIEPKIELPSDDTKADLPTAEMIKVNDIGEAREYLANHCGVSRTRLKTVKAIKEVAKSFNIEFKGLE